MKPASSLLRPSILVLFFLCAMLGACEDSDPDYRPADLSTRPGERLWRVEIETPGLNPLEMDRLVADPFIRFLDKDGRVDVTGTISRHGSMEAFIRAPVYLSSVMVISLALGTITLPNGTLDPEFEAAGPPLQSEEKVEVLVDGSRLNRFGLSFRDLLKTIRNHPPPESLDALDSISSIAVANGDGVDVTLRDIATIRKIPGGAQRPCANQVVRLEGTTPEQVNERVQELEKIVHSRPDSDQDLLAIPTEKNTVLLEPNDDAIKRAGLTAEDIFSFVPIIRGAEYRVWPQVPVVMRMAEPSPEEVAELLLRDGVGNMVALRYFVSMQLTTMPDRIIRKGLHVYSGYILIRGDGTTTTAELLENADFSDIATYSVPKLPDAEAAILGWPIPRSKP